VTGGVTFLSMLFDFFVNAVSQDLQMAQISNFACEVHVVGGHFTLIFLQFIYLFFFFKNTQNSVFA